MSGTLSSEQNRVHGELQTTKGAVVGLQAERDAIADRADRAKKELHRQSAAWEKERDLLAQQIKARLSVLCCAMFSLLILGKQELRQKVHANEQNLATTREQSTRYQDAAVRANAVRVCVCVCVCAFSGLVNDIVWF